jgi:NAD(P)H-dependent flavin oxidoreductase YrpB (nitropropane dioxygenase family)
MAGGVYRGSSLAAALSFGATGVWVGTRFVCAEEAGASKKHQEAVIGAGYDGEHIWSCFLMPVSRKLNHYTHYRHHTDHHLHRKTAPSCQNPIYHGLGREQAKGDQGTDIAG